MKYVLCLLLLTLGACSDTQISSVKAIGSPAHIVCYSGNLVILDTMSTGRVETVAHSDGWEFRSAETGKFIRVSGPCIIEN